MSFYHVFTLMLLTISRMRIEASSYYFVKHDKTQNTDLKNVLENNCYAWTCNLRNELSTCTNQGCLLASNNVTVPKELRHAKEIRTTIKTYVNYCGGNSYDARKCIPAMFVTVTMIYADSTENTTMTYADLTYNPMIEESFLAPNWSAVGAPNSNNFNASRLITTEYTVQNRKHASPYLTLISIRIAIQPYKFCGKISDAFVFTDTCLRTVNNLVEYPLSVTKGRVNGTCVANSSPVKQDDVEKEFYATCQPAVGYVMFKGSCTCNRGHTVAINGTSCQGIWFTHKSLIVIKSRFLI